MTAPVKKDNANEEIYSITRIGGDYNETTGVLGNVRSIQETIYRYALVKLGNSNIYVEDNIVYAEDLQQLLQNLGNRTTFYVTNELITNIYGTTKYKVHKTAADFTATEEYWTDSSKGKTQNGLGSALNVYDNKIIIPQTSNRKVYVKHINIGTGSIVNSSIIANAKPIIPTVGNNYITVSNKKIFTTKTAEGYQEYYEGIKIDEVIKKTALMLGNENLVAIGYNIGIAADRSTAQANVNNESRQGKYNKGKSAIIEGKTTTSNDEVIVIEFYYSNIEQEEPETPVVDTQAPAKDVGGKLFVTTDLIGVCSDAQQFQINSTPSGKNATVGIENIPQYMAGAVNLSKQQKEHELEIWLVVSNGKSEFVKTFPLKYKVTYYNITNMLIYKFAGATIYDAGYGYSGTTGDSIFSWNNGILTDNTLAKTPTVKLSGINNKSITNNNAEIKNESNYVNAVLNTNFGTYNVTGKQGEYIIRYEYLTELESKALFIVDRNNSGTLETNEIAEGKKLGATWVGAYEKYKKYLELRAATALEVAQKLNMSLTVSAKNMGITIDGNSLYSQTSTASKTVSVKPNAELTVSTTKPTISKDKYNNLTNNIITKDKYKNSSKIAVETLNGVRGLAGVARYKTDVIIGSATQVEDNVYYTNKKFKIAENKSLTKSYKVDTAKATSEEKYSQVNPINIYTPITVNASIVLDKSDIINQTTSDLTIPAVQLNTPFTIKITNNKNEPVYGLQKTTEYNLGYFIKFDFDVHNIKIGTKSYKNGQKISAGTWIGLLTGDDIQITVQAYGSMDSNLLSVVSEEKSGYTVRAVAYNSTNIMRNTSKLYPTIGELFAGMQSTVDNICTKPNEKPSYFDEIKGQIIIVSRMYGFRITDLKDLEWKNTFRITTGSSVNRHTGKLYYSGITKWDTTSSSKVNKIVNRTTSEIGRNPLRILPLGPYKNTEITKTKAPKLGYRFSYDFNVTGTYFDSSGNPKMDKYAKINTKFYYISKDGKTFIEESNGKEGIYLFYKNSAGKYVRIDNNGGNYELKFTPNDGYRYMDTITTETLAKTSVSLGNLRNITLRYNMATPTNNNAAITYYGEYKLPNSTIAVKVDSNGDYDINKPLTDGYIGVIFDISTYVGNVIDNGIEKAVVLKYLQNTQDTPNTSQWDYEGFLGFTNYGSKVKAGEISLRLEKGIWNITDTIYNKIKGTVILYDMDERAAEDYN